METIWLLLLGGRSLLYGHSCLSSCRALKWLDTFSGETTPLLVLSPFSVGLTLTGKYLLPGQICFYKSKVLCEWGSKMEVTEAVFLCRRSTWSCTHMLLVWSIQFPLTLLHWERPKLHGVLAVLSAKGLIEVPYGREQNKFVSVAVDSLWKGRQTLST